MGESGAPTAPESRQADSCGPPKDSCGLNRRPEQHGERDRAIELDDGRRRDVAKRPIESDDPRPVGLFGGARARMTGSDRCLQRIWSRRMPGALYQGLGAAKCGEPPPDEKLVPPRAVLVEQKHWLARWTGASLKPRRLN